MAQSIYYMAGRYWAFVDGGNERAAAALDKTFAYDEHWTRSKLSVARALYGDGSAMFKWAERLIFTGKYETPPKNMRCEEARQQWLCQLYEQPRPRQFGRHYCQRCGEYMGWLGRFVFPFFHRCGR